MRTAHAIPLELRPLLWSADSDALDVKRDHVYIVHQVLSYGTLEHLKILFTLYSKEEIIHVFTRYPKRLYQPAVFYFIKNIVLGLTQTPLEKDKYVKHAY